MPYSEKENFAGMKILIVDDTPANIDILGHFLRQSGLEISIAPDGEIAQKIISNNKPDLILLDVMMPGVDGYQLCEILKANDQTKNIPIIFITARSEIENVVKGFEVGGVDYIVKPLQELEVLVRVKSQLSIVKLIRELKRSNRDLKEFTSIASHDLKEPLRKIIYFGEFLKEKITNVNEEGHRFIDKIQDASNRMNTLIDDLLIFSSVSTKEKNFERHDLTEIAQDSLVNLENRIEITQGKVNISKLPSIEVDPSQLGQLFQNLIGNSLKYHREGTPPVVNICCKSSENEKVEIVIEDNGIGFNEKYTDKIFQPLERLHGRSAYEGSGIGLAICKKIVDRHHGTISVKSTEGMGSTFIITLPENQTGS
jgi:signal transduction histidine kinase